MKKKRTNKEEVSDLLSDALERVKRGDRLEGTDGVLASVVKHFLEESLEGEMDAHLDESRPNRRNGKGKKRVKTSIGDIPIETPRDRDGTYAPELIPKRQRTLDLSIEKKILSLYSMGMSYRDICSHIEDIYEMELSAVYSGLSMPRIPVYGCHLKRSYNFS